MTGPEHYRLAERLATGALLGSEIVLAHAQVHATLALAAAVAGLDAHEGPGGGSATGRTAVDANAWAAAITPSEQVR